jgi:hypothetical protein
MNHPSWRPAAQYQVWTATYFSTNADLFAYLVPGGEANRASYDYPR